jgi:hypothetical protein
MLFKSVVTIKVFLMLAFNVCAEDLKQSLSFNFANTALFSGAGLMLKESVGGGVFLPLHFSYQRKTDGEIQELDFIYRYDNHAYFSGYQEIILAYGKRFALGGEWTWGAKFGVGYAFGPQNDVYENEQGQLERESKVAYYRCFQGVTNIDFKNETPLKENWNFRYGGGLLLILPLACNRGEDWSTLGLIVHRIVPVADVSLNYNF